MTSCIFFKMIRDVCDEKNKKPQGVLRNKSKNKKKSMTTVTMSPRRNIFNP
nr:unnamed protein product [Callosobruchus analis]